MNPDADKEHPVKPLLKVSEGGWIDR